MTARCALYTDALKIFGRVPEYAHGYFSRNFQRAFVPVDPMNVITKFKVRSFTRSRDSLDTHTLPFSKTLMGFCSDGPWVCTGQI